MHKKIHSTEAISKTFSKTQILNNLGVLGTPGSRPNSANKRIKSHNNNLSLDESLIAKNKKLSVLIRNLHGFVTNIE